MSNYINVLRRLERERRVPEPGPVMAPALPPVAVPTTSPVVAPVLPSETTVQTAALPAALPVTPPMPTAPPAAPVVAAPAPRTVIPLPSVTPTPVAPRVEVPVAVPAPPHTPAHPPLDTRRARAFATDPHPGIATLLDNIRMLAGKRANRIIVLCGASTAEAVTTLAMALADHAGERGLKAVVGTLVRTAAGTVVAPTQGARADAVTLPVDLDAGSSTEELHAWARQIAPQNDLVVLTGPPLASSIDAALLACACDGLVIVAESEVTDRAALQIAAERARIAGCRTLGVVMHGTKDHMPGWIRRIVGDHPETAVRED